MKVLAALGTVIALCACADNGQTGSPAGTGGGTASSPPERTCAEHDCIAEVTARYAHDFGVQHRALVVVGASCERIGWTTGRISLPNGAVWGFGEIGTPACACEHDDDGAFHIGPNPVGCAVRGHAHDCLMEHGEIEPCDEGDPNACEDVCAELQERLDADAMTSKPFVVRSARCEEYEVYDYITTECSDAVIEIDGYCYDATSIDWNRWQSCELDDAEILSAPAQLLPDCGDYPESVPRTADCLPVPCDDASDCGYADGCDHGPSGEGYGLSGRGRCYSCTAPTSDCLPTETCAHDLCVLPGNAECDGDEDCGSGTVCTPSELPAGGRGNEGLTTRCLPPQE